MKLNLDMNNEKKLVLITSQLFDSIDQLCLKEILKKNLDWDKVIRYATKNKVMALLYHNLILSGYKDFIPKCYSTLLEDSLCSNTLRNNIKLSELEKIQRAMQTHSISFVPVKGGYLIDNLYGNRSIRTTNDIDGLIKKSQIVDVDRIMKSMGYESGTYDYTLNEIIPVSKTKKMLYKTKMYNLVPYIKVCSKSPLIVVVFDLSFALDFTLDPTPVNKMLDSAIDINGLKQLRPEHFFIHLCCHHYREASHTEWIKIGKDLTIMKFCDVREYVRKCMSKEQLRNAINFAKKYKLERAVYFTIYFLREIYSDGYETEILMSLGIKDETFLYQYGENEYDSLKTRKKDFWASIFSDSNNDELSERPRYELLL